MGVRVGPLSPGAALGRDGRVLSALARGGAARRAAGAARTLVGTLAGRAVRPRFLTYVVTFACNARCVMCGSWKRGREGELSTEEIDRVLSGLPPMDVVRLTGGEPFLRPDLTEIAALVERHLSPALIHVTTNGLRPDAVVEFCERRPRTTPLELLVSIDGIGAKHDAVRGREGAFARALETVRLLAPRQDELAVHLAVNQTVVDDEGLRQYRLLREVLAGLGVRNAVVVANDQTATYGEAGEVDVAPTEAATLQTFGPLAREALRDLLDEVTADLAGYPFAERVAKGYYTRGARRRLLDGKADPSPPCAALGAHLRLYPDGTVPTCHLNSTRVGDLRRQTFSDLWSGVRCEKQRRWVRACPGCWAECEVLPSALYSGALLLEAVRQARGPLLRHG